MLLLTSENEISMIIYSLFRGRQKIFTIIFRTKFVVKCATKNFENRLTNKKVMFKNNFRRGNLAWKGIIFPEFF